MRCGATAVVLQRAEIGIAVANVFHSIQETAREGIAVAVGRIVAQVEAVRDDGGADIEKVCSVSAGSEDGVVNGQRRWDARLARDGLVQNATAGHGTVPAKRIAAHDGDAVDVMNAASTDRGDVAADGAVEQCEGGGKVANRAALGPAVVAEGAVAQRSSRRNGRIIGKGADRAAPATAVAVEGAAFDGDHTEIRDAAAGERVCLVPADLATLDRGGSGRVHAAAQVVGPFAVN